MESRKATASAAICDDSSIGTIGVTANVSHGTQGSIVRASVAALSTSTIATARSIREPVEPLTEVRASGRLPARKHAQ